MKKFLIEENRILKEFIFGLRRKRVKNEFLQNPLDLCSKHCFLLILFNYKTFLSKIELMVFLDTIFKDFPKIGHVSLSAIFDHILEF